MKYRITESRLRGIIRECVRRSLNENIWGGYDDNGKFVPSYATDRHFPQQDDDYRTRVAVGEYPDEDERRRQMDADWEALDKYNDSGLRPEEGAWLSFGNNNVKDNIMPGCRAMWAMSDDPSLSRHAKALRPTWRESSNALMDYYDKNDENDDMEKVVGEAVRRALDEAWTDDYENALDKKRYDELIAAFMKKPWLKRQFLSLIGRKPKDPFPGTEARAMANKYAQTYNDEEAFHNEYDDGSGAQVRMSYDRDTLDPVLSRIFREQGYIDPQIRKSTVEFDDQGRPVERGLKNYEEEAGFQPGMPDDESFGLAYNAKPLADRKTSEVGAAVARAKSRNNDKKKQ